jgi:hypothetical protein
MTITDNITSPSSATPRSTAVAQLGSLGRMSARLLQSIVWMCLTLALPSALQAHEDTIIQLKGTNLVGLPKNYAPAELDTNAFRLRIGSHAMTFSPFLKSLFDEPHELRISASWYHERSTLPPYLLLHIQPKKKKDFSYSVLLDMDTLDVIEVSVTLRESDTTSRDLPVALSEQQKEEIRKSIETIKQ